MALGALITAAGIYKVRHAPGVIYSQTKVRFIAPLSVQNPNGLGITPISIVMTAGVVAQLVDPRNHDKPNDENVTIVGLGTRNGWSVTLPQSGGQFAPYFGEPWVVVQVAGSDVDAVNAKMTSLIAQVNDTLTRIENEQKVSAVNRIRTKLDPEGTPSVIYLHGSSSRSTLAVLVIGISITSAAVVFIRKIAR